MHLFKKHPKFLSTLSFGILWNTFGYYGIQTVLVLYLIHSFHYTINTSYSLYGIFLTFNFTMPILGGIIADQWLGYKNSVVIGALLNILGNLLLTFPQSSFFALGMSTMLLGSGLYISSVASLVGLLYKEKSTLKEKGYTLYYVSINAGGALAPIFYGIIIYIFGWHWIFLCNILFIALGLLVFFKNLKYFPSIQLNIYKICFFRGCIILGCIFAIILIVAMVFLFYSVSNQVVSSFFIVSLFCLFVTVIRKKGESRRRLFVLIVLSGLCSFYYMTALQTGTTVIIFIQQKINSGLLPIKLPASMFNALYCFFAVILLPIFNITSKYFSKYKFKLNAAKKISIGIIFSAIAMGMFAVSSFNSITIVGILLGYLFLSAGELILAPAVYTAISDLSPSSMKSTMIGVWMLFIAIGGYLSSILAKVVHSSTLHFFPHASLYRSEFLIIALIALFISFFSFFVALKLEKYNY